MKKEQRYWIAAGTLLALFVIFTLLIKWVDVRPVGPQGSEVGFAAVNSFVHERIGVHMLWYQITNFLGMASILTAPLFAAVGLLQMIRRRSLLRVDRSLLVLGGFYVLVAGVYVFFECCIVNYRPILMDGQLEASYPSSHTILAVCLLSAVILESRMLLKTQKAVRTIQWISILVMVVTVVGRLLSGVHWLTDIVGSLLISGALVALLCAVLQKVSEKK